MGTRSVATAFLAVVLAMACSLTTDFDRFQVSSSSDELLPDAAPARDDGGLADAGDAVEGDASPARADADSGSDSGAACGSASGCDECLAADECRGNAVACGDGGSCGCEVDADCSPRGECWEARCGDAGECSQSPVARGVVAATQVPFDCLVRRCDGAGGVESVADDSDAPIDSGEGCVRAACVGGSLTSLPRGSGVICGGEETECSRIDRCDGGGRCAPNHEPAGTPAAAPPGDCRSHECDGEGGVRPVPDNRSVNDARCPDADRPFCVDGACAQCFSDEQCGESGDDCVLRACEQGLCVNRNAPSGAPCGDGADTTCSDPDTCDGAGTCQPNEVPGGTVLRLASCMTVLCDGRGTGEVTEECDDPVDRFCDLGADACVACRPGGFDCGQTFRSRCDPVSFECVPCQSDLDCAHVIAGFNTCNEGECVQ